MKVTKSEKAIIREHVLEQFEDCGGRNVRICKDGNVTVDVDSFPNSSEGDGGRCNAGNVENILSECRAN